MPSVEQLMKNISERKAKKDRYSGPTTFMGETIGQDMSPNSIVRDIMSLNEATQFSSILQIGWAGSGKTTMAEMFAHMIHTKDENWAIHWMGANELREIENVLNGLAKSQKHFIVFDDVSNALRSVSSQRRAKIFEVLTQGRHITAYSKLIIFSIIHYTNAIEKSVRAQNLYYLYTSSSLAEETNLMKLIEGDKRAIQQYKKFKRAFSRMMKTKKFELKIGPNNYKIFTRDKPFRVALAVDFESAHIFLSTKLSCAKCSRKRVSKFLPPREIVKALQNYTSKTGVQALAYYIATSKSRIEILPTRLQKSLKFVQAIFTEYDTDWDQLAKEIQKTRGGELPKRAYMHKKLFEKHMKELKAKGVSVRVDELQKPEDTPKDDQISEGIKDLFK